MPKHRPPYGYIIVASALLIMVMIWGTNHCFGVFFKSLLSEFGWTRAMTAGAFSLAVLMEGFGSLFMGPLADRFGARVVLAASGLFFGVGFVLMSKVNTIGQFYLIYGVVVGIGLSGCYVPIMSTLTKWFIKRRGTVIAIVSGGVSIGTMIMSPIANRLILAHGWRASFVIFGTVAMVGVAGASQLLRNGPALAKPTLTVDRVDKEQGRHLNSGPFRFQPAGHTGRLWLLCAILFSWAFSKYSVLVHITPHIIELSLSATQATNILAFIGGCAFVTTLVLGLATDRIGSKRAFTFGLTLMAASLFWLLSARTMWSLYLFAAIFSFGYACGGILMPTIIAEVFGVSSSGAILGIINFSACIGCAAGPVVSGYLFDKAGDYQLSFTVAAAVSVVNIILISFLKSDKKPDPFLRT